MLIRSEIGVDAAGIDGLLRRCCDTSKEALLVSQLRERGLLTLGMVASDDEGQVLGYAAFSPVTLNGEDSQWVGLAPLVVDARVRDQGIARQLVYEGLDTLNEFGYAAVVVAGEPGWYGSLGFEPAVRYQLYCDLPEAKTGFHVYKLADGGYHEAQGIIHFAAPFNLL